MRSIFRRGWKPYVIQPRSYECLNLPNFTKSIMKIEQIIFKGTRQQGLSPYNLTLSTRRNAKEQRNKYQHSLPSNSNHKLNLKTCMKPWKMLVVHHCNRGDKSITSTELKNIYGILNFLIPLFLFYWHISAFVCSCDTIIIVNTM
jgi:hypothetical protein